MPTDELQPSLKSVAMPFWLDAHPVVFPPTHLALEDPNGLLAVGGALTPEWLTYAYSKGIFPWFSDGDPIMWWTPSPRSVLFLENMKIRRSLKKTLRKTEFTVTMDQAFDLVIKTCASVPRSDQDGTWITNEMLEAYQQLHKKGIAHSVEVWNGKLLVGGLYGIAIGKVFFGESMFSKASDASKIGFVALCEQLKAWEFRMIDTQMETDHLNAFGAELIGRTEFETVLKQDIQKNFPPTSWRFEIDWHQSFTATPN